MTRTFHVHLSVRDALSWPDSKLRRMVADENGDHLTPTQVREWLLDQLEQGRLALPIGPACKGFDYKRGCPGHRSTNASSGARAK